MYTLYIIGTFEAVFLAVLLILKKNKNISDNILASYIFLFGITIFLTFFDDYNIKNNYVYPHFLALSPPFALLHGPILWFYSKSITNNSFKFKPVHFLHILPFIIMFTHLSFQYYFLPIDEKIYLFKNEIFKNHLNYKIYVLILAISIFSYLIWSISIIIKHIKILKNANISFHKIDLKWIKFLFIAAIIVYGITLNTNILDLIFHFISYGTFQFIVHIFSSVFILALGFYGHRQSSVFSSIQDTNISIFNESYHSNIESNVNPNDIEFIIYLVNFMKKETPYLNTNINVSELAKMLSVTPDYLSEIIKDKMNMHFLDFVNSYRINEFKERVANKKNKKLTLISIAYDSGFNSKATFNRVFMKKLKMTPSQYKELVCKK